MNQITADIILIIMISILLIAIIILIVKFDKDKFECLANPINYYENLKDVKCNCIEKTEWNQGLENVNLFLGDLAKLNKSDNKE